MKSTVIICLISLFLTSCIVKTEVDTIIHNATVYTVNGEFNIYEALAIDSGIIVAVGPEHEIMNAYQSAQTIDAKGRPIYPGFIDAHSHFLGYGLQLQRLNLVGTKSFEEVLDRVQQFIKDHDDEWITGRGWDQNDWEVKEFPSNVALDSLFPDRKIVLKRIDGHAILATSNVFELAGINDQSTVPGGRYLLNKKGLLQGIAIDEGMTAIKDVIPEPSLEQKNRALIDAEKQCFEVGLTTVTDAGLDQYEINLISAMQSDGELKMRVYAMYSAADSILDRVNELPLKTDRLNASSIKVYADGALGSRGAALLEDYTDDHGNSGLIITPADSVYKWAQVCKLNDFQFNVHCIGDRANRIVLEAMSKTLGGTNDRRWRIEHAQVMNDADLSTFGEFNILPSMQPTHATSDMYWAEERLGEDRMKYAYAMKTLKNQNGLIALGTDFPVEDISPIKTYYASVARKDSEGYPDGGFKMTEGLTREETLKGITIWAAIASFEDENRGSIEVGKFADLVLLDRDIMTCEEDDILSTEILQTWNGGELVYEK